MWTEDEREFVAGVLEEERFRLNGQLEWWKEESSTYKKLQAEAKLCDAALAKLATAPDAQGECWEPVSSGTYDRNGVIVPNADPFVYLVTWDAEGHTIRVPGDRIRLPKDWFVCQRRTAPDAPAQPQGEALDFPDGPGWWAFEGKWNSEEVPGTFRDITEVQLFQGELQIGLGNDWEPVTCWIGKWYRLQLPWDAPAQEEV